MATVFDGQRRPIAQLEREAQSAVANWPFDPRLRRARHYVIEEIRRHEMAR